MTKFEAIGKCMSDYSNLDQYDRAKLIELYYQYSPRDCVDLIDTDSEFKRINTIPVEELKEEVDFYMMTFGY